MSKKNNTAQKAALEAEKISNALKENTEKTLRNILKEAIEDMVMDDDETVEDQDADSIDNDSYEVQDVETDETSTDTPEDGSSDDEAGAEASTTDVDDEGNDDWSEYDDYKVGDNEYDLTGVDGDLALKIFQSLNDNDQICVKKTDDGQIQVSDCDGDANIVLELEPGDDSANDDNADMDSNADFDIELDSDDDMDNGEMSNDDMPNDDMPNDDEIEIDLDDVDDDDDTLNEDLGYTDNYQKDVMPGLNMNEPANKKATYSMDGGVPQGNKKPWAGKHTEKDYKKTNTDLAEGCNKELEEGATTTSSQSVAKTTRTQTSEPRGEHKREVAKEIIVAGKRLDEAKALKILEAAKAIQAENKQIKALTESLKKSLTEAAILNLNYGKIVNLLVNECTTKDEKRSIVERFMNIKTEQEGKILFESIKRELNESHKNDTATVLNEQISAESSKRINETQIYTNESINLMKRMDNLSQYNRKFAEPNLNENANLNLMARMDNLAQYNRSMNKQ